MFDRVAKRYDLVNDVCLARPGPRLASAVLDAAGPGRAAGAGPRGRDGYVERAVRRVGCFVVPTDFSMGMLGWGSGADRTCVRGGGRPPAAVRRSELRCGHHLVRTAERLRPRAACTELRRVTRPGGRLVICEFSTPTVPAFRWIYDNYLVAALPADRPAAVVESGGVRVPRRVDPGLAGSAGTGGADRRAGWRAWNGAICPAASSRCTGPGSTMTAHPSTPLPSSTDHLGVDGERLDLAGTDPAGADPYGASDRRVLLDSGAARTCPVKTQNAFHPWLRRPEERLDPAARARRDAQAERRGRLLSTWLMRIPGAVDLRGATADRRAPGGARSRGARGRCAVGDRRDAAAGSGRAPGGYAGCARPRDRPRGRPAGIPPGRDQGPSRDHRRPARGRRAGAPERAPFRHLRRPGPAVRTRTSAAGG